MLLVVWATMHALTSRNMWFPEQKWCDTGLALFYCLMSAMCPLNLSLNVLSDCATY